MGTQHGMTMEMAFDLVIQDYPGLAARALKGE